MALTANHPNNELVKFRKDVAYDFLRSSRFDPYMGDDSTSIVVRMGDLEADGKEIRVPLVTQLAGDGVGAGTMRGNEEQIDSYGMPVWADWARNAVANNRAVNKESSFNIRSTARSLLRGWSKRIVRDDLVDALLSLPTSAVQAGRFSTPGNRVNGIKFSAATAANKNSWVTANYDRVVFGSQMSNYSTTFATAVANVDSTNDKMTAAVGSLAKDAAKQTGVDPNNPGVYNGRPKINPYMIEDSDQEWYVCFLGSRAFRDLKADPVMYQANRDARNRENGDPTKTNPIFTGGSLVYDGIIYKEIPEITQRLLLKGVGASSIDVEPFFLCGQGALAYATGQMPRPTQLEDGDYDFITGLGIEAQYGVAKIAKAPLSVSGATLGSLVDWGMVTGFVSGVANA
ncbi:hypothetical protein CK227_10445 [Mesorhizobium sp. WSM4308]|uniref:phage capsid family protein n=1 Tax=Mesorhizobium sp. WSM4308 TaxID=2029409 RepID=UPI000BAF84E8|nr:DUF4043 family protein [Mesorhizobium sp. WSM4308]PBB75202.1 hypothetical protein CK227_10445 [Mesorhizobium sp. WSM4308]